MRQSIGGGEAELYTPIQRYLENRGYHVGVRVHPRPGSPREFDVVGVKPRSHQVAVVEAKTSHFPAALRQAQLRLLVSDLVYVSFPRAFARNALIRHRQVLHESGIGLLGVDNGHVRQILPSRPSTTVSQSRREDLIAMVLGARVREW